MTASPRKLPEFPFPIATQIAPADVTDSTMLDAAIEPQSTLGSVALRRVGDIVVRTVGSAGGARRELKLDLLWP
jgi:hypothetical protein